MDDFLKGIHDAHKERNEHFKIRLQRSFINAACRTGHEHNTEIERKQWKSMQPLPYRPARDTSFKEQATPSAHMDPDPIACARFYIFRFGSMTVRHQWDGVDLNFDKEHFRNEKTMVARVERRASMTYRKFIFEFVARTILRTGGLSHWRNVSRFQDRHACFEAGYDELPEYCDAQSYEEEGASVNFENLHSGGEDYMRCQFREFTKLRFMRNCEQRTSSCSTGQVVSPAYGLLE